MSECPDFKPLPVDPDICYWWDTEETEDGHEGYCSRPDWNYRECETKGRKAKATGRE